jgi:preprotein translocase subunit SecD
VRDWAERTNSLKKLSDDGALLAYTLTGDVRESVRRRGMSQVLEVLRRRIADPVRGIPDSVVTRQGEDRILVQIPGGQIDRSRARELLRVTGFLEFKIVADSDQTEELLRARYPDGLPEDTVIAFERDKETDRILTAYLLEKTAAITGDYLKDARVDFDRQQRSIVTFTFNVQGAKIFGELRRRRTWRWCCAPAPCRFPWRSKRSERWVRRLARTRSRGGFAHRSSA